jgi:hypothetical protein
MVRHVSYFEARYDCAARCVQGIRERIALGWNIVELRGPVNGPFLVLYRMDDAQ